MQHCDLWTFLINHKTEIVLSVVSFTIIAFARQTWCCFKLLFLHVYKSLCITKQQRFEISKQIVEMNAEAICMVLQILQTRSEFLDYNEQELLLFDQQVSRQLLPMVSRLRGASLALKKVICDSLGDAVCRHVDECVTAIDEVTDWHYPIMTYKSLRVKCLKALENWQFLMKSILTNDAIKEWAIERMEAYCFLRGTSGGIPLCGYDNLSAILNDGKLRLSGWRKS